MESEEHPEAESREVDPDPFPPTRWTMVARAADPHSPRAREALSSLCQDYWFPLYAYARRKGLSPEDAEDVTQAFFVVLIRRESLGQVEPGKGKLRAFLLGSFKNFMISERRKETAEKRGGGQSLVSLDLEGAEERISLESSLNPEKEFDRQWALQLIDETSSRLEMEFSKRGKEGHFEAFKPFLSCEQPRESQIELADQLGMKPGAVRIAIFRARKRFSQIMREVIAETVSTPEEVETELEHLFEVFG
ncbi:MAG: RNA polymerase sigma factor [Verrucomicrobiota bacterium]